MELLKKHYEKLILSLVLLALAAVAVMIFVQVGSFRKDLDDKLQQRTGGKRKELIPIDLSTNQAVLKELAAPIQVPLGGDGAVFTAPRWKKTPTGDVLPDTAKSKQGPAAISGLTTTPLYLSIEFSRVSGTPDAPRYEFVIGREFEKQVSKRSNTTLSCSPGEGIRLPGQKSYLFRLLEVKGPASEPTELYIQLTAGNERAIIAPRKPFRQVMGYAANFRYEDKRDFRNIRVEDPLPLSGVSYKVVSVSDGELVISAPNQVRSTISRSAAGNK